MNSNKIEINLEDLEKIPGGTTEEALAYIRELCKKCRTNDALKLNTLVTREELDHLKWLLRH